MKTFDADEKPQIHRNSQELAKSLGLKRIQIMCSELAAKANETIPVNFIAHVESVPVKGDRILLEDGGDFRVKDVYHKLITNSKLGIIQADVIVFAERIPSVMPGA